MCRACKTTEAIFTVIGYIPYERETLLLKRLHAWATGVGETKLCLGLRHPLPGSQLILTILWRVKPQHPTQLWILHASGWEGRKRYAT